MPTSGIQGYQAHIHLGKTLRHIHTKAMYPSSLDKRKFYYANTILLFTG